MALSFWLLAYKIHCLAYYIAYLHRQLQIFALEGATGGERQKYVANKRIRGHWDIPRRKYFFLIMQNAAKWAISKILVRPLGGGIAPLVPLGATYGSD